MRVSWRAKAAAGSTLLRFLLSDFFNWPPNSYQRVVFSETHLYRRTQRDEEALGQADADSAWKSGDQAKDKGKAESGEGTKKGEIAQESELFNNSSSPSPWALAAELAQLYRSVGTDPSPLPACPSCSLTDVASSLDTWISLDSPQPKPF